MSFNEKAVICCFVHWRIFPYPPYVSKRPLDWSPAELHSPTLFRYLGGQLLQWHPIVATWIPSVSGSHNRPCWKSSVMVLVVFASFSGSANTTDQAIRWHKSFPTVNIEENYPLRGFPLHGECKTITKPQHKNILFSQNLPICIVFIFLLASIRIKQFLHSSSIVFAIE